MKIVEAAAVQMSPVPLIPDGTVGMITRYAMMADGEQIHSAMRRGYAV